MSRKNRGVIERWIVEGVLELVTPTSLSNGDDDPLVDLPIVVDALEGVPLLTGASLAGALRAYLADCGGGYAEALFGGRRGDADGGQSALIVEDARGPKGQAPRIELRDGVSIDPATRTAKDEERYDRQLLAAGTTFDLGFELVVTKQDNGERLRAALAAALGGLQAGHIRLGGRKRRGYGQCRVTSWRAWRYELGRAEHVAAWLAHDRAALPGFQEPQWVWVQANGGAGIGDWPALQSVTLLDSKVGRFALSATFDIDGAVLIRSGFETESGPDASHLRSHRGGKDVPVLSGTSLAGVIRGQTLRIARTMAAPAGEAGQRRAETLVQGMFGYMQRPDELPPARNGQSNRRELKKQASRVMIDESVIEKGELTGTPRDIVQTRVKIDRFTGGAFESALFAEQPAFGGGFVLNLSLRQPTEAEVGLLLLVLKDLWTGFLPVGGSSSVGRGRLKGRRATIEYGGRTWTLAVAGQDGETLTVTASDGTAATELNRYVTALTSQLQGRV